MAQAGAMGLPFIAVRGLLCSDVLKHHPGFKVIENPFNRGEVVVVTEPYRPDAAAFHALKADRWGNAITPGFSSDLMLAEAARKVVVTAEEIADRPLTRLDAGTDNTFIPAIDVDAVALVPRGCHPGGCGELYRVDEAHLRQYLGAAASSESFRTYLDQYVYGVSTHQEYLDRVGMLEPLSGRRE